ncbi:efflux RND transporter permease subunit, partial [Pseudomonas mosselii]|nr:efflux RND transporter permease subunit [Pseudomonas mosselii]
MFPARIESGDATDLAFKRAGQIETLDIRQGAVVKQGQRLASLNAREARQRLNDRQTAVVITHYPGASAQQVEEEVTLPLENALQQLPYLDNVSSISSNGLSQITVNIASRYHSNALPQIWDELRRRVGDAARQFPPGVVNPFV